MLIGLRTLKTGLAVILSIVVGRLFHLEYPFFIAMTAIISMDKTMINSLKMGRNRVFGTFLGACIGITLSYIDRGNALLCGIGMVILISICNYLKLQGSITIGGIVMVAIMVHTDKTPIFYGFHRTLDTLIGAGISFIINLLVFPYSRLRTIDQTIFYFFNMLDHIINTLKEERSVYIQDLKDELDYIKTEIYLCKNDLLFGQKKKASLALLEERYDLAKKILFELEATQRIDYDNHKDIYDYHVDQAISIYQHYLKEHHIEKMDQ